MFAARQPRHVRRPHHHLVLATRAARTTCSATSRSTASKVATTRPSQDEMESKSYSVSAVADRHQEPDPLRPVRSDHRRRLPPQPVSLGALLHRIRSRRASSPSEYPNTRSSNAGSFRAKYFLPYRAALDAMYRFYTDTWGIVGHTGELGYVHPLDTASCGGNWIFEGRVRYYRQDSRGFLHGHLPARRLRQLHGARQGTRDLQRHHRRRRRHLRIQDRALPLADQGPDQPALRPHDGQLRRLPRCHASASASFGMLPEDPLPPGTEPLYKLRANIIQFYISAFF